MDYNSKYDIVTFSFQKRQKSTPAHTRKAVTLFTVVCNECISSSKRDSLQMTIMRLCSWSIRTHAKNMRTTENSGAAPESDLSQAFSSTYVCFTVFYLFHVFIFLHVFLIIMCTFLALILRTKEYRKALLVSHDIRNAFVNIMKHHLTDFQNYIHSHLSGVVWHTKMYNKPSYLLN